MKKYSSLAGNVIGQATSKDDGAFEKWKEGFQKHQWKVEASEAELSESWKNWTMEECEEIIRKSDK